MKENYEQQSGASTATKSKLSAKKIWIIVVAAILACVILAISIWLIVELTDNHTCVPLIGRDKEVMAKFDNFVAFGGSTGGLIGTWVRSEEILGSALISKENKDAFNEYAKKNTKNDYYNIYLGVKDGAECVLIECYDGTLFEFPTTLGYSLSDVVKKFEELSGQEITSEFLTMTGRKYPYDQYMYSAHSLGIVVYLTHAGRNIVEDNHLTKSQSVEFYTAVINNQIYVVTREMMLTGNVLPLK